MQLNRRICYYLRIAFFFCLSAAFSQTAQPFAVLKSGPVQLWGVSGFERHTSRCLYGVYSLQNGLSAQVWAVPVRLDYDSEWKNSKLLARTQVMKKENTLLYSVRANLKNQYPVMQNALDWTLVFEFVTETPESERASFVSFFIPRFEYFGSLAKVIEDMSFPAILQAGKN